MNKQTSSQLPILFQSRDIALDSFYCGKWEKISKSSRGIDLDQIMPNVELIRGLFISYNIYSFIYISLRS